MYNKYYLDVNSHPIGDVRTHGDIPPQGTRSPFGYARRGTAALRGVCTSTAVAEERHFTLAELDAMAPDHPLFLRHISGHLALCNSKAFEAAGITDGTLNPSGGVFRHDGNGRLTGIGGGTRRNGDGPGGLPADDRGKNGSARWNGLPTTMSPRA